MGFSGKPSKGCLPCRQKRTKCDLALPACSQCIRKNRICTGYRNEQDLLFRNETKLVVRKVNRRPTTQPEQPPSDGSTLQEPSDLSIQQLSRRASVHDEAVLHFFAHYNEKLFCAAKGHSSDNGVDYVLPVFQSDALRGGPVSEIVTAAGMAALGNMKGAPDLVTAARAKQVKVLRQLNEQLRDPKLALSDSSILTCCLLGSFESIVSDGPQSAVAQTYHLRGAVTIAEMRGRDQFADAVGHGIYARMRGGILAQCMRVGEPLPAFVLAFLEDDGISQRDFQPILYKKLGRLCQLRYEHKTKSVVDTGMLAEAQKLLAEFMAWKPDISEWDGNRRPSADSVPNTSDPDETYRIAWLMTMWIFRQIARILCANLVIEGARGQTKLRPSIFATATLGDAIDDQIELCDELKDSLLYYSGKFTACQSPMRTVGAYMILFGLSGLSSASTCSADSFSWMAVQAETIAENFGLRQARMLADFMRMRALTAPVEIERNPVSPLPMSAKDVQQSHEGSASSLSTFTAALTSRQTALPTRIHRSIRQGRGVSRKRSPSRS